MKKKNKKGFTLIELIVVIAILAILAIIAIPVVSGLVDKANDSAMAANARTLELAAKAYLTEEDDSSLDSDDLDNALDRFELKETDITDNGKFSYTINSKGTVTQSTKANTNGKISVSNQ
ncbi:prepilin-type N-terminal cleavage/methylation domain-containing protein [Anaerovorax odorimutans]|uniref:prepilin-type N-terminal cleavage/methylation domain-containing protein n=1 Tax=Anaerovorax odorimutans TaxID=109327 RepID=UPI000409E3A9|nr:prepilin-type N-terminal cleavage/methylation domain-containing protein [Anaerovorax odorimutans]